MDGTPEKTLRDKKPYFALAGLAAVALAVIGAAVMTTSAVGTHYAIGFAEEQAVRWNESLIGKLKDKRRAFVDGQLTGEEIGMLKNSVEVSDVYRYVLFNAKGEVYHSSKASKIGQKSNASYFFDVVAKGNTFTKHETKTASEIDGLLQSRIGAGILPNDQRYVIETYMPVMENGVFIGAFELYVDATDQIAASVSGMRYVAGGIAGVLAVLFSIAGMIMVRILKGRNAAEESVRNQAPGLGATLQTNE